MADPDPPRPGEVRMLRGAFPDIRTGSYRAELRHRVALESGTKHLSPVDVHLDVAGPRFTLSGPEIHSVFPPANADGSFSTRLPHIALKRRTLPWERSEAEANDEPWLALVVLADFEGHVTSGPVREAFTPSALDGLEDRNGPLPDGTCQRLEVTRSVVDAVFPTRADLPWLAHARQVSLLDAENLRGDLDGWLSVVVANRLPARADTAYGAYLVSLEGQLGALPEPAPDDWTHRFGPTLVHGALVAELLRVHTVALDDGRGDGDPDRPWLGAGRDLRRWNEALVGEARDVTVGDHTIRRDRVVEIGRAVAARGVAIPGGDASDHSLTVVDWVPPITLTPLEPVLRFPVLASWSFRTEGRKDFQALMEGLDVGLMTTTDTTPPLATDTGHTVLQHRTRDGESRAAWYRGPLAPVQTTRRGPTPRFESAAADAVTGPADGDGPVLDLSESAAFELGRLLALSDPAFLEALSRWRRASFVVRRRQWWGPGPVQRHPWQHLLDERIDLPRRLLELEQLRDLLEQRPPVVDPVEHLALFDLERDVTTLASGFAMQETTVRASLQPGWTTRAPDDVGIGGIGGGLVDADVLGSLGQHRDMVVTELLTAADDFDRTLAAEALRDLRGGP